MFRRGSVDDVVAGPGRDEASRDAEGAGGGVGPYGDVDAEEDGDYFEGGVAFEELFEEGWDCEGVGFGLVGWFGFFGVFFCRRFGATFGLARWSHDRV